MKSKILFYSALVIIVFFFPNKMIQAQILGGGATYATAVTFNPSWLIGCPSGSSSFCNTSSCEPTTTLDACGSLPGCTTGTTGSDVWFKFYPQAATVTIVVNPTSAFDIAIQAFSGTCSGGLTDIGCVDANGNNATETLTLTGLSSGTLYYFRIFGATNSVSNRTGNYNFCGTSGLLSSPLPLSLVNTKIEKTGNLSCIKWFVENEFDIASYEVEYSINGIQFVKLASIPSLNQMNLHEYSYCDVINRLNGLYRIKINELSGEVSYSPILRLKSASNRNITIFPNPSQERIYLDMPADIMLSEQIKYIVLSAQGTVLLDGFIGAGRSINIQQLQTGNYILKIVYNNKTESLWFRKK
jgi:hypothetical protein